jgi:hypothetical protein
MTAVKALCEELEVRRAREEVLIMMLTGDG